jgi:hypothetical protein
MWLVSAIISSLSTGSSQCPRVQTYDPSYPVCLQIYGIDGGSIDCSFTSLAQCAASALRDRVGGLASFEVAAFCIVSYLRVDTK